jgi:dTDP-4-dehydrorhamnose 3,5-epimerase
LGIADLILVEQKIFIDERGCFIETFKQSEFEANGINYCFVQDNHSKSKRAFERASLPVNPKAQGSFLGVYGEEYGMLRLI